MTPAGALKAVTRPAAWLARHLVRGLSIVGLAMHGQPYPAPETDAAAPARTQRRTQARTRSLTPDELLWLDELRQGESEAFE